MPCGPFTIVCRGVAVEKDEEIFTNLANAVVMLSHESTETTSFGLAQPISIDACIFVE